MRLDPGVGVALHILRAVLALAHALVLRADVGDRQGHDLEQLRGGRVLLDPQLVRHDVLVVYRKAVVAPVGLLCVGAGLHARHGGERHFQPDHVDTGAQHVAEPVRRPRIKDHRLALLETRNGVGNQRRIVALRVGHRVEQLEGAQLVVDHGLATPAGAGSDEVGLAIAGGVEQLGQLRVGELAQVGDLVAVGGFLVDHVALAGARGIHAFARQLGITTSAFVELRMVRVPVVGHEGGVAAGHGDVRQRVLDFLDRQHVVAQFSQSAGHQNGLESFFGQRALQGQHLDAFAGQVGRGVGAEAQGQQAGGEQGASCEVVGVHRHSVRFFLVGRTGNREQGKRGRAPRSDVGGAQRVRRACPTFWRRTKPV